jgi:hypothetical protein
MTPTLSFQGKPYFLDVTNTIPHPTTTVLLESPTETNTTSSILLLPTPSTSTQSLDQLSQEGKDCSYNGTHALLVELSSTLRTINYYACLNRTVSLSLTHTRFEYTCLYFIEY